jgi:hypothetical protein
MTLPQRPKRTQQGSQVLKACPNECGNRIAQDQTECSSCQNMTRSWEKGTGNAHPRGPR